MFFETLILWLVLLLFLVPILYSGIVIIWKTCNVDRFELLIPVGSVTGIFLFVFLLNLFSFFLKGVNGIIVAYLFLIIPLFLIRLHIKFSDFNWPKSRKLIIFYSLSIVIWAVIIFWKGNHALIGSDVNLYYSIAHTFIKGNFPPQTPWQPDLPLSYHLGAPELLGAFYAFTGAPFEFLHIFFSSFFIFLSSQIIIWIWKRHLSVSSFIWGNLAAAVALISFGFFKFIIPYFPLKIKNLSNFHEIFLWIRDLPTVYQSIEIYGASVNLDSLIYFIFHSFGLAIALSLIVIVIHFRKEKQYLSWVILIGGLASLALVNETIFVIFAPAVIFGRFCTELQNKTFIKNLKIILLVTTVTGVIVFIQGGIIANSVLSSSNLNRSVLIFPKKEDIKEDFISYHQNQQLSKALPIKQEWLPFRWFHIGTDILIPIVVSLFFLIKYSKKQQLLQIMFITAGIFSLLGYNFIVPKYLVANSNRFLVFAFINFSLSIIFSLQNFKPKLLLVLALTFFILLPTLLSPITVLSKTRFGENKLIPKKEQMTSAISWMEKNLPYNTKAIVLDARAPHPSGMVRAMVQAGVFAPIFQGDFKAYTIEASPEYFDIAYFLSPKALIKLDIDVLLIDGFFYQTLSEERKAQLENERYFEKIFTGQNKDGWEKIYKIKNEFKTFGNEIEGTFDQMQGLIPSIGEIYIDKEENFDPSFLRRALIFSLRNKEIYFLPQSGVYLNVEENINSHSPKLDGIYDFFVLGKNSKPETICNCRTVLVWVGLKDQVFVWKKIL